MNIPSSSLKKNLISFFYECEELLRQYDLRDFLGCKAEYRFIRKNIHEYSLKQNLKPVIPWHQIKSSSQEKMKELESINRCVSNLIDYFGLPYANEKPGLKSEDIIKGSQEAYKHRLVFLFFKYKELQEKIKLSIPEYVTLLIKGVWSESIYFKTTAQLIGLRTNLEKIKIHSFTIRLPTEKELSRIINDYEWSDINISYPNDMASFGLNQLHYTCFWVFMETRQDRPQIVDTFYNLHSFCTRFYNDEDNVKIIAEFKKLILSLRLYNGNYIGIRSIFIKKSFIYEGDVFNPWIERPFLDAKFSDFRTNRPSFDIKRKEIFSEDVNGINTVFSNLMLYEQNPLEQIDRALDHFFQAFEQTYPVYIFTELIMAFETLFHKDKTTSTDTSVNILNKLLPPEKRGKEVTKFFNNNDNNGCYQIRNGLLHGDINLDSAEIRKKIPDLEEYVRLALLKIIELRINDKLDCNEENYFEKLNEASKVNVRESSKIKEAKSNL